jgi:hypothetical protein
MPATPPTIVAPIPADPRVIALAKSLGLSRREAFGAAAEAWAWMSVMANDGLVVQAAPDSLDGLVDVAGFGAAMVDAGLVGVVDDGLVLPAELRGLERDDRATRRGAVADDADDPDKKTSRRKEQNRVASRKYRRREKVTGSKSKPAVGNKWRSLGHVAGHEVRVFDGPHGCYAMVLGATVNGQPFRKLTAGDKAWSLESVRLVDTLPALVDKWKAQSRPVGLDHPPTVVPPFPAFRDDAERLMALATLQAADGADASSRHADASAIVSNASSNHDADSERNPLEGNALDASSASSSRHADGLSSMSYLSKSSSIEEEDMREEGRQEGGHHDQGDHEPAGMAEWDRRRLLEKQRDARIAEALGLGIDTVKIRNRTYLALQCRQAGIDPQTGFPVNADAPSKPPQARPGIDATTEPTRRDKPATGSVGARDDGELFCDHRQLRQALQAEGIPAPVAKSLTADDDAFERSGMTRATTSVACGPL